MMTLLFAASELGRSCESILDYACSHAGKGRAWVYTIKILRLFISPNLVDGILTDVFFDDPAANNRAKERPHIAKGGVICSR
jgi:hypothetical protein